MAVNTVTNIPMINPDIITGISMMLVFVFVGRMVGASTSLNFWTMLISHVTFCLPYVIFQVLPKLQQMDKSLTEAAMDLGCTPFRAFFKVTMPEILPGIITGAIMAFKILDDMGADAEDIATIVTAIGNHDEGTGLPVSDVAAALILADKTDVRRSRVRNEDFSSFDIHDRVNYSVVNSRLDIDIQNKTIRLVLVVDTKIGSIMDYFEIFLARMTLCRKAAERLGLAFKLTINEQNFI